MWKILWKCAVATPYIGQVTRGKSDMARIICKARLGAKGRVVLPKEARRALGLKPGDSFAFLIDGDAVRVVRLPGEGDNPFACFSEWASEADRKGYADL